MVIIVSCVYYLCSLPDFHLWTQNTLNIIRILFLSATINNYTLVLALEFLAIYGDPTNVDTMALIAQLQAQVWANDHPDASPNHPLSKLFNTSIEQNNESQLPCTLSGESRIVDNCAAEKWSMQHPEPNIHLFEFNFLLQITGRWSIFWYLNIL